MGGFYTPCVSRAQTYIRLNSWGTVNIIHSLHLMINLGFLHPHGNDDQHVVNWWISPRTCVFMARTCVNTFICICRRQHISAHMTVEPFTCKSDATGEVKHHILTLKAADQAAVLDELGVRTCCSQIQEDTNTPTVKINTQRPHNRLAHMYALVSSP